jgi:pyrroloquinoline quinone biosynthesis protein B
MRVRVLGSAAGGGFPQWNCSCAVCTAAREGRATQRTQSSLAIRGDTGPWFVVNASPDIRAQLAELPVDSQNGARTTPIGGVLLTDAEVDHATGLLLLRESSSSLQVYCTDEVRAALTTEFPLLRMLERYCGVDSHPLAVGRVTALEGSSLEVEPFPAGGDAPLYMGGAPGPGAIGLTIRERGSERPVLLYAPALASLDEAMLGLLRASDCVLVDGTFWRADELVELGVAERDSWAMGHAPLSGAGGTLEVLAGLGPRTILVHINNTNPVLLEKSEERAQTEARGVEVGYDGMEFEL